MRVACAVLARFGCKARSFPFHRDLADRWPARHHADGAPLLRGFPALWNRVLYFSFPQEIAYRGRIDALASLSVTAKRVMTQGTGSASIAALAYS
jgi:hypothetical protein